MGKVIEQVDNFYKIIALKEFRKTSGVNFDILEEEDIPDISSIDRVMHKSDAISPGKVGEVERPWYMHPNQADNLMVLHGTRFVEIFKAEYGKIEYFEVNPYRIIKNGTLLYEGAAMLVWSTGVFHRIKSAKTGSASINFAVRSKGFDINTNFNIYDLDTDSGKYKIIRKGWKDQF